MGFAWRQVLMVKITWSRFFTVFSTTVNTGSKTRIRITYSTQPYNCLLKLRCLYLSYLQYKTIADAS